MGDAPLQRMIAEACLAADAEDRYQADLGAFLDAHGVGPADREAILGGRARLGLYRRLVRNNLLGVVARMLRRTRAVLDDRAAGLFDATFDAFLDEVGPRSHYLRDVPHELFAWAARKWTDDGRVPWAADLAALELVSFAVAAAPRAERGAPPGELAVDAPVLFAEAVARIRAEHAVHLLPDDPDDRSEPEHRRTELLAYRDEAHEPRFLELTPLAAAVTDELLAGAPLGAAIATACTRAETPMDAGALATVARLLADYGERGVILGAG